MSPGGFIRLALHQISDLALSASTVDIDPSLSKGCNVLLAKVLTLKLYLSMALTMNVLCTDGLELAFCSLNGLGLMLLCIFAISLALERETNPLLLSHLWRMHCLLISGCFAFVTVWA